MKNITFSEKKREVFSKKQKKLLDELISRRYIPLFYGIFYIQG